MSPAGQQQWPAAGQQRRRGVVAPPFSVCINPPFSPDIFTFSIFTFSPTVAKLLLETLG
jgi:hypothetical protein